VYIVTLSNWADQSMQGAWIKSRLAEHFGKQ
jgi:hypothetical protein